MGKSVYLCGSMSGLKNFGAPWREKLRKWLEDQGEEVFDPCVQEAHEHELYKVDPKQKHKWEKLPHELQARIIHRDLDQVGKNSKYLICYFTKYSTGTVSELSHAFYNKVPVYFVTDLKLKGWPATVAHARGNRVFGSFEGLKSWLKWSISFEPAHNNYRRFEWRAYAK